VLWSVDRKYGPWPFEQKPELESAVFEARGDLFGETRAYLDVARALGTAPPASPDGFLIDLSSRTVPALYVVQIDLASRAPLRHVAQQLLDVYLTTRGMPKRVLGTLRQALQRCTAGTALCEAYSHAHGYPSIEGLLEELVAPENFRALVIVDALEDDFERGLRSALRFPIEILTFRRFRSTSGRDVLYDFEPFLQDLSASLAASTSEASVPALDPHDVDTLVVPAREEGFREVFLGEQMWGPVRIPESMIDKIRYIAGYQVAPVSAITHVAEVDRIEPWSGSSKYTIYFKGPAQKMGPIHSSTNGSTPAGNRYTSFARLCRAHTLEEVF
jgi:hypothetical protein